MRRWQVWGIGLVVVACVAVVSLVEFTDGEVSSEGTASMHLSPGTFVVACGADVEVPAGARIDFVDASESMGRRSAWMAGDAAQLGSWLRDGDHRGLVVGAQGCDGDLGGGIQELRAYRVAWPLVGRYLNPAASYYQLSERRPIEAEVGSALAEVARGVLSGEQAAPRIDSFPDSLRRLGSTEMMVLLRDGSRPRLWRSARGRSRARALLTAISYARSRWAERETAMGGSLEAAIDRLHVEVIEVEHHGVVGSAEPGFIDDVVGEGFGVGYERAGGWRYVLPRATASAGGGAAALADLLEDNGLIWADLERPDVRAFRFRAVQVGVSDPSGGAASLQD